MNGSHLSGSASSGKIASTGHSGSHAPQSMHSSGSITRIRSASWMKSTGQTSTHERSLMSMQGSAMMYVTGAECTGGLLPSRRPPTLPSVRRSAFGAGRGEAASDGRRQLLDEVTRTLGQSRLDDDLVEA